MGFWSGFESLTGHRPGAFTGFTLKDILDKDMWEMRERLGGRQSRQFEETGVMPTTAIYKGMGKEGMFGDVVGRPYGGAVDKLSQPAFSSPMRPEGALAGPPQPRMAIGRDRPFPMLPQAGGRTKTSPYVPTPRAQARPLPAFIPGVSPTQGLDSIRHWGGGNPNTPGMMAADPTWAGGLRGAGLNAQVTSPSRLDQLRREPKWIDKTTTVKRSAADNVPDTTTTVYKEKLDSASTWQPESGATARPFWGLQDRFEDWFRTYKELARRRHENSMANRTWRGY